MAGKLKIGELASAAGVSCDTVRYYERMNVLPPAVRSSGGYRLYDQGDVERLRFIKQAQSLGLSLDEIKALLPGLKAGLEECRRVRDLLRTKLEEFDQRIAEMRVFQSNLAAYLRECEEALEGKRGDCCPVIFEITRPSSNVTGATNGAGHSRKGIIRGRKARKSKRGKA